MRALLLAALLASPAAAAETAAFLEVGAGARALAMGGAYTALADDAHAVYWNPAGLARLEKREAAASHAELGETTRHDFLAYAHPTPQATFAGAFTHLSQGAIEGRDSAGRLASSYDASDSAFAFAAGRKTDVVDVGASLKYVRSHIASTEAQGVAFDFGARKEHPLGGGKAVIGAALRHVGPDLKYQDERNDLPTRLALGAAYRFEKGHSLAAELQNGPREGGTDGGIGAEFKAHEAVMLRLGYTSRSAAMGGSGFEAARGLTLGLGLYLKQFRIDYAAQAAGELGNMHRFSMCMRW